MKKNEWVNENSIQLIKKKFYMINSIDAGGPGLNFHFDLNTREF